MTPAAILERLHRLGIDELKSVTSLHELDGRDINLECRWPNGATGRILDDTKKYYGTQVEGPGSERCHGIAADEHQIAVFTYGCGGSDAELVLWLKL